MQVRIQLSEKDRSVWSNSPSHISDLLINVVSVLAEVTSLNDVVAGSIQHQFQQNALANTINFFSAANAKSSALIGAYFRSAAYPDMVALTEQDWQCMEAVLKPVMPAQIGVKDYLNSFTEGRSPRDAHIALLQTILFTDARPEALSKKVKYVKIIPLLIQATLTMVEFMNTPFAVLADEADVNKKGNSGLDLQWISMKKAVLDSLKNLVGAKQKKSTGLLLRVSNLNRDMLKFDGAFGNENVRYQLTSTDVGALKNQLESTQKQYAELQKEMHAYGQQWQTSYDQLQLDYQELKSKQAHPDNNAAPPIPAFDEALAQETIRNMALTKENDSLKAENDLLKIQIDNAKAYAVAPPLNHDFGDDIMQALGSPQPAASHQETEIEIVPVVAQLSEHEVAQRLALSAELATEMTRINNSRYGHHYLRDAKAEKLQEIKAIVDNPNERRPLAQIVAEFVETNRKLLSAQRRSGLFSIFNPAKSSSLRLLERFAIEAPAPMVAPSK
jgi:hypothetical protein